jgi:hypothetical protein
MSQRHRDAQVCQDGASNRRRISRALHEAIEECANEGVDADKDGAVFLILHQLAYLLTGHDIVIGNERLDKRYDAAMKEIT